MRYRRVLLVNPKVPHSYMGAIRPSISLGYLSQTLLSNNIEHRVVDMMLDPSEKQFLNLVERYQPDLIGFYTFTYMYKNTYQLIEKIKQKFPKLAIVIGGPHLSTLREKALRDCPSIDFGVVLEGEETIVELCRDKKFGAIKGLIWRRGNEVVFNGERLFIENLDAVPSPKYEKFELNRYIMKEVLIISSRGCPHQCVFCPVHLAIGRRLRMRSPANVVDEIEYWYRRGRRQFNFADDNFTFFKDRVLAVCDEIEHRGLKGLDLRCGNGVRADKVDRELLERMRSIGFNYLAFGVESGSDKVLTALKKGESLEKIEAAIRDACEMGYDVTLFFLVGSPGETWDDFMKSIELARKYPVIDVRFYNLIPYPSTELFEWVVKNKLFVRDPEDYLNNTSAFSTKPVFATTELPYILREKALRYGKKVRREILYKGFRRKLKHWGFIGLIASFILATEFGQEIVRYNKWARRLAEHIRYQIAEEDRKG